MLGRPLMRAWKGRNCRSPSYISRCKAGGRRRDRRFIDSVFSRGRVFSLSHPQIHPVLILPVAFCCTPTDDARSRTQPSGALFLSRATLADPKRYQISSGIYRQCIPDTALSVLRVLTRTTLTISSKEQRLVGKKTLVEYSFLSLPL